MLKKITTKVLLISCLIFSIILTFVMDKSEIFSAALVCLIFTIFILWLTGKFYDFDKKKLRLLSGTDKALIMFFILPTIINGPLLWVIFVGLFFLFLLLQKVIFKIFKND